LNCLHHLTPYIPGYSQLPSTDFSEQERQVGMTSDEWYAAKQKQRGMERNVRSLKRKVALGQERGLDMTADRYRLGRAQANLRAHCATTGLRRDYERERAYGVSQQPRGLGRVDFNSKRWQGQYPNPTAAPNENPTAVQTGMFRKGGTTHRRVVGGKQVASKPVVDKARKAIKKAGGEMIIADERWKEHLRRNGATAETIGNYVIVSEDATTSEVLEETYHMMQNSKGVNDDKPFELRTLLNEIEAKKYLIGVESKMKIPEDEQAETREWLEIYERRLEAYRREHGHE
jgi:hypothetical protein